jgi:NADH-quinone oxidoreductase subunit J
MPTPAPASSLAATTDPILFWLFAALALGSAIYMVAQRNPTYSAFSFIVTLCSLSAIYGLLGSSFIAVLQVVVYAGAIMVLFLFVLMLLNVRTEDQRPDSLMLRGVAVLLAGTFLALVGRVMSRANLRAAAPTFEASAQNVARELFSPRFLYVFEATSILILAALVGAILLARKEGQS